MERLDIFGFLDSRNRSLQKFVKKWVFWGTFVPQIFKNLDQMIFIILFGSAQMN